MAHRDLAVLDAAERAAVEINRLTDRQPCRLLYVRQMRDSAQAVAANIAEGFGRRSSGRDLVRSLEIARGEAEETIRHLRTNLRSDRLAAQDYWPLHDRLRVIVKMLDSFMRR